MAEKNAYAAKRSKRPKNWKSRSLHDEFGDDEFGDRQRNGKQPVPFRTLPFRTPASLCGRLPLSEGYLGFPKLVNDLLGPMALAWHDLLSLAKHPARRKLTPRVGSD